MPKTITPAAINLLQHAQIKGNLVTFPQVDYSVYAKVKPVMQALDAPWNRGKQAHVFADDADPWALIQSVLIAGKLPDQNPLAFFPTSEQVAKQMLHKLRQLLPIFPFCKTLEPSAGEGAIAWQIVELINHLRRDEAEGSEVQPFLKLIELDNGRFSRLEMKGYHVEQGDFLEMQPEPGKPQLDRPLFDAVAMNAPFAVAGQPKAYIQHTLHAFEYWLRPGGALVAIAPGGFEFNQDRKTSEFRSLVEETGGWESLPDDSFKGAGTKVSTVMLWMRKAE